MSEVVLFSKLREAEEELKAEREARFRLEKDYTNLKLDLSVLESQYDDILSDREREVEYNRKLKQEYDNLKSKFETLFFETEESTQVFKKKNIEQITELSAHVESLSKSKSKYEKDNKQFLLEIEQLRIDNDSLSRSKAQAVALCRELETRESEHLRRVDEVMRQLNESNESKHKLSEENATLTVRIERLEFEFQQINVTYKKVCQELDDAKMHLENEILFRNGIENKYRSAQLDLTSANAQLDIVIEERDDYQKQLSKANEEIRSIRERCDRDLAAKAEEFEDAKRKLNSRNLEIQEELNVIIVKLSNVEKVKQKLQVQVDNLITDLDREKKRAEEAVRIKIHLEDEVYELKNRLSAVNGELDAALAANRNYQAELTKARSLSEQLSEQIELLTKEKRRLFEELEVTNRQLSDANNRILDDERRLKLLEAERLAIQSDLDDAKDSLQIEINKYSSLFAQFEQYKLSMEKKLLEKDDEIDALRQSHRRQIEVMQENIESLEARYKSEISSIKKKYQIEIEELRFRYDSISKSLQEAENNMKRLHQVNIELNDQLVLEQRAHDQTREQMLAAEKRAGALRGELEELKTLYERLEKLKKTLELEYHELEVKFNDTTGAYNRAIAERRKFEADYLETFDLLQDVRLQLKNAEERARNATSALAKKDEEIRHERELALELDAARKALEQQLREAQARLEESEEYTRKEIKRVASKYESRLLQLEADVELERQKAQDYIKEIRRLEKRCKDLVIQVEEEQTRVISLTESHEKLQDKMKKYRSQIEGAEAQVAINLSRNRRLQRDLDDAEQRADTMTKTFLKSGSVIRIENEEREKSVIDESSSAGHHTTASYLRPSYLLTRASYIDDYAPSSSRAGSSFSYRLRYKTVDLDDADTAAKPNRYSSYYSSSSASQRANNNYSNDYARSRAQSRSRMSTKLKRSLRGLSV